MLFSTYIKNINRVRKNYEKNNKLCNAEAVMEAPSTLYFVSQKD